MGCNPTAHFLFYSILSKPKSYFDNQIDGAKKCTIYIIETKIMFR